MRKRLNATVSQREKQRRRRQSLGIEYTRWRARHGIRHDTYEARRVWENERRHYGADRRPGRMNWRRQQARHGG